MNSQKFNQLISRLKGNSIRVLDLSKEACGEPLTAEQWKILCEALKENKSLHTLDLRGFSINKPDIPLAFPSDRLSAFILPLPSQDNSLYLLISVLSVHTHLRVLILNGWNAFDVRKIIVEGLLRNKNNSIDVLSIENCRFEPYDADEMAKIISHPNFRVRSLSLANNRFGIEGLAKIAIALQTNTTLEHLDLSFNRPEPSSYAYYLPPAPQVDQAVEWATHLVNAFKHNKAFKLQTLELRGLIRTHQEFMRVAELLIYTQTLTKLDLSHCVFADDPNSKYFIEVLQKNTSLRVLDLSNNNFTMKLLFQLLTSIASTRITQLNLQETLASARSGPLGDRQRAKLIEALAKNVMLKVLNISDESRQSCFSPKVKLALQEGLERNAALSVLFTGTTQISKPIPSLMYLDITSDNPSSRLLMQDIKANRNTVQGISWAIDPNDLHLLGACILSNTHLKYCSVYLDFHSKMINPSLSMNTTQESNLLHIVNALKHNKTLIGLSFNFKSAYDAHDYNIMINFMRNVPLLIESTGSLKTLHLNLFKLDLKEIDLKLFNRICQAIVRNKSLVNLQIMISCSQFPSDYSIFIKNFSASFKANRTLQFLDFRVRGPIPVRGDRVIVNLAESPEIAQILERNQAPHLCSLPLETYVETRLFSKTDSLSFTDNTNRCIQPHFHKLPAQIRAYQEEALYYRVMSLKLFLEFVKENIKIGVNTHRTLFAGYLEENAEFINAIFSVVNPVKVSTRKDSSSSTDVTMSIDSSSSIALPLGKDESQDKAPPAPIIISSMKSASAKNKKRKASTDLNRGKDEKEMDGDGDTTMKNVSASKIFQKGA